MTSMLKFIIPVLAVISVTVAMECKTCIDIMDISNESMGNMYINTTGKYNCSYPGMMTCDKDKESMCGNYTFNVKYEYDFFI